MFGWFKSKPTLTREELDLAMTEMREHLDRQIAELKNTVEAAIKSYQCVICLEWFARLPHQSEKRCPACQLEIKRTGSSGSGQGNSGHRGPGHATRGIHKGPKP